MNNIIIENRAYFFANFCAFVLKRNMTNFVRLIIFPSCLSATLITVLNVAFTKGGNNWWFNTFQICLLGSKFSITWQQQNYRNLKQINKLFLTHNQINKLLKPANNTWTSTRGVSPGTPERLLNCTRLVCNQNWEIKMELWSVKYIQNKWFNCPTIVVEEWIKSSHF